MFACAEGPEAIKLMHPTVVITVGEYLHGILDGFLGPRGNASFCVHCILPYEERRPPLCTAGRPISKRGSGWADDRYLSVPHKLLSYCS